MPIRTCVPFTLFVRCIEDNKSFSIYTCDSSCSLDHISQVVIRELSRYYGYAYKSLHFDIYTDFDFLHTKYFKP